MNKLILIAMIILSFACSKKTEEVDVSTSDESNVVDVEVVKVIEPLEVTATQSVDVSQTTVE